MFNFFNLMLQCLLFYFRLHCDICGEKLKTWTGLRVHYAKVHNSEPYVYCVCGFAIRSKSVLYKHASDHKIESRKLRKNLEESDDEENEKQSLKYASLNVKDFIRYCLCKLYSAI